MIGLRVFGARAVRSRCGLAIGSRRVPSTVWCVTCRLVAVCCVRDARVTVCAWMFAASICSCTTCCVVSIETGWEAVLSLCLMVFVQVSLCVMMMTLEKPTFDVWLMTERQRSALAGSEFGDQVCCSSACCDARNACYHEYSCLTCVCDFHALI